MIFSSGTGTLVSSWQQIDEFFLQKEKFMSFHANLKLFGLNEICTNFSPIIKNDTS